MAGKYNHLGVQQCFGVVCHESTTLRRFRSFNFYLLFLGGGVAKIFLHLKMFLQMFNTYLWLYADWFHGVPVPGKTTIDAFELFLATVYVQ